VGFQKAFTNEMMARKGSGVGSRRRNHKLLRTRPPLGSRLSRCGLLGNYSMSTMKSSKALVQQTRPTESRLDWRQEAASRIARLLLYEPSVAADGIVCEASVHRGKRSLVWIATFTGPAGGQVWRSTGLVNRAKALWLAKRWEREARAQRSVTSRLAAMPILPNKETGKGVKPLSQREVATLLGISERAVRLVERRAFQKLLNHPLLRRAWRQYLAGELDEHQTSLTTQEIGALFKLVRSTQEWLVLEKVTRLIRG
jgi:hypothetical protein